MTPAEKALFNSNWSQTQDMLGLPQGSGLLGDAIVTGNATTAAITLYVATTGNDANDGSVGSPLLTFQAAINKIPKYVRHPVTINVGAGNFTGAYIDGFTFESSYNPAAGAYILVAGTLSAAVPASGPASGTFTSGTAGSHNTWGTATLGAAGWTINDLRGKIVHTIAGTGSGQYYVIASNTADTITVAGTWTAPGATTTFEILTQGTNITTGVLRAPAHPQAAVGTSRTCFWFGANLGSYASDRPYNIAIRNINLAISGYLAYNVGLASIYFDKCKFTASGGYGFWSTTNTAITTSHCYCKLTNDWVFHNAQRAYINNTVVETSSVSAYAMLPVESIMLSSLVVGGLGIDGSVLTYLEAFYCHFDACPVGIRKIQYLNGSAKAGSVTCVHSEFTNCTTAIDAEDQMSLNLDACVFSGNTTNILLATGASAQINSEVAITGGVEISIDGNEKTLAELRAASPKLITSSFGTKIYQKV